MSMITQPISHRERELAAIVSAYNQVTDQLKNSHEALGHEVRKLRMELEDKNRELARRERLSALGEMAAGVAHEIRNPLGSIQLYASLLERDLVTMPKDLHLARRITAGVKALDKIVSDVLEFAGHHDPKFEQVPLQLMISNVFELSAAAARQKGVRLLLDTSVLGHEVWVDQDQLERAILNVVLNGIDAAGEGGAVEVAVGSNESNIVQLHISDDGAGIDEQVMDRIFNPFFTTKDAGTGLGLAIVHRIMESHHGRVEVCRRGDGRTCFTLHLPMDDRSE